MDVEMDFRAGDIQSQSELLPFSSNACTTQTPPAGAPGRSNQQELLADTFPILLTHVTGMHTTHHPGTSKSVSRKNRTTLVPPVPPTTNGPQRQSRSRKNRDKPYQEEKRLGKKKDLSSEEAINRSCRPAKVIQPCACPLCPRRFKRCGLIPHL